VFVPNEVKINSIEIKAISGVVAAIDVANLIISKYGVAFCASHKIVGALVKVLIEQNKTLNGAPSQLLSETAMSVAKIKLMVKSSDIVACTNLHNLIETYKVQGGPSPAEVKRAFNVRIKTSVKNKKIKDTLTTAVNTLNSAVKSRSLYSQETVRLKNLD
jgi:argininosuccinate lyase